MSNSYDGLVDKGLVSKETFATAADMNLVPVGLCNEADEDEEGE